ncbi:helix-turn-helix domain-containing protein [Actinomadura viridis]|uniref:Transcriptional regulator with XRE-family HTH domain n=1 Tax=Actinomadura viridis TaxID=58110 RepID=A0A931DII5_9ACTN|nr:helix-turn-helix transcriptional regulator [Actinomadura viridis]MBG6089218.1 transcriptional regulator with XRE-family HTH domain [Actinomadura viridis]
MSGRWSGEGARVSEAYGATIAKWRLSRRLKTLREEAGYTANQVCDRLNWGRGKVGRFEANSWVRPELSDIRDLARVYGQVDGDLEELERLAAHARARAWWRGYPEVFANEFPGFEADASSIRVMTPLVLPGLLQTPAYIRALMATGARSGAWRDAALAARLRRQRILDRDDGTAPELLAIISEASLLFRWGGREDRRAQLAHLVEMGRRPNIEIRLLRFGDGLYPGMSTLVNLFRFPGEPSMVYLENDVAIQENTDPESVEAYEQIVQRAREAALGPAETADFLDKMTDTLE